MSKSNTRRTTLRWLKILSVMIGLFLWLNIRWTYAQTGDCTQRSGGVIRSGASAYGYSTVLWAITGQNYSAWCVAYSGLLTCINGNIQWNASLYRYTSAQCNAGMTPRSCTLPWGWRLNNLARITWYSTILRAITGQNYSAGCPVYGGLLTCINGVIQWNTSIYRYSNAQCNVPPKSCSFTVEGRLQITGHNRSWTWYSAPSITYPGTCSDISAKLTCFNGNIRGNIQTYIYSGCRQGNPLTQGIDLEIVPTFSGLPGWWTGIAQLSNPMITLALRNNWTQMISGTATAWFIKCTRAEPDRGININVYTSPALGPIVINPGTKIAFPIQLRNIFTQSLGEKHIVCVVATWPGETTINLTNNKWTGTFDVVDAQRFDLAMDRSIISIKKNLEAAEATIGPDGVKNFVYTKVMSLLVPMVVVIGILISIIGFYKIMFSDDEKTIGEGTKYVIYGVIGIIVIMSAKYIGSSLYSILTPSTGEIKWFQIAQDLYDKIAFPFIKLAIYLALGAMFVILVSRVITFVFGTDADAKKNAGTIIGRNILGMLVIIGAKQIVEAVYGKQADVVRAISNLWEIGTGILSDRNIPLIYSVVNRVLWLTALVLLVLIIVQTIQLLVNPSDEKQMTNVKNSLLYMVIGIVVIAAGYLIVNFLIIN